MPCETYSQSELLRMEQRDHDQTTKVACEMAALIRLHGLRKELSQRAKDWMKQHERLDRQRQAEEREQRRYREARQSAIRKLANKEREALGVRP